MGSGSYAAPGREDGADRVVVRIRCGVVQSRRGKAMSDVVLSSPKGRCWPNQITRWGGNTSGSERIRIFWLNDYLSKANQIQRAYSSE